LTLTIQDRKVTLLQVCFEKSRDNGTNIDTTIKIDTIHSHIDKFLKNTHDTRVEYVSDIHS